MNVEESDLELYICKVIRSKGKVFLYCRQVCLCHQMPTGSERFKSYK
jgi:hypothetical protein